MQPSTKNSRVFQATKDRVYAAFSTAQALEQWLVPGEMTGKIHQFDFRVGGGYEMSLFYPETEKAAMGKTTAKEDKYRAVYLELVPDEKIVEAIRFDSPDPAFAGEMIMEVNLEQAGDQETKVTIQFRNIPAGIKPADNEAGTEASLEKLAQYVEGETPAE